MVPHTQQASPRGSATSLLLLLCLVVPIHADTLVELSFAVLMNKSVSVNRRMRTSTQTQHETLTESVLESIGSYAAHPGGQKYSCVPQQAFLKRVRCSVQIEDPIGVKGAKVHKMISLH
ncbi:hypothetical protein DPX16_9220 [Anabarilius grahami]|uniref:Uncharacterized protein n=1 Tax=Anabarilius grahami TaxID=495550 RepID=A0A3N0Y625_ANAGA|nr:hypothetical protein DPX16_9220 [Anabarilius grahami]